MSGSTRLGTAVVFLVALAAGVFVTSLLVGGFGGSPAPSASLQAQATPSPSSVPSAVSSASPSTAASTSPSSPEPTPTETATPTRTPKPTVGPGIPAAISLSALKLDAADDPAGVNRVITFSAQGTGTVSAHLSSISPQGETKICLKSTKKNFGCKTTSEGMISADTSARELVFTLTLRGVGIAAPVVDVALTFPATRPAVTIDHARFDGTGFPDTNGLDATITPRSDGGARVVATWGGHPLLYDLRLKEQGGPGAHALNEQGPSTGTNTRLAVTAPNPWRLVLRNAEEGFGATELTARIAWP